jgi:predicted transcriptional regulator
MPKKGKKTGLAGRIRAVMHESRKPFTPVQVAEALGIPPGPKRETVAKALLDFWRRGEVNRVGRKGGAFRYSYNHAYRRPDNSAELKRKVLKAIRYVINGPFTSADILRLTGDMSKSHVQKIIRGLVDDGQVETVGEKKRELSYGLENVYRVINRERFRRELL